MTYKSFSNEKLIRLIGIISVVIITVVLLLLQIRTTTNCPDGTYNNAPHYNSSVISIARIYCSAIEIGWPLQILSYDKVGADPGVGSDPGEINYEKPAQIVAGLLVDIAVIISPTIAYIIFRALRTKKSHKTG